MRGRPSETNDPSLIGDPPVLVVDSRAPGWMGRGVIPGLVDIPWNNISVDETVGFPVNGDMAVFPNILINQFGANRVGEIWDFSNAKTLVLLCNGIWSPQSATNIKTLTGLGTPRTSSNGTAAACRSGARQA